MCIHDVLRKIISKNDLDLFLEITNEFIEDDFNKCNLLTCLKNLKLFSLFKSIENNAISILKYLLQFDLANEPNNNEETPLHWAARYGHKEIVEMLLHAGANHNAENDDKETPLHWAARKDHKEIVEMLLQAGANPNAEDNDKETPLHWAARYGHKEIVEMLLKAGADLNVENNNKNTPLHLTARYGRKEIVELLLQAGANLNVEDNDKWTPLHLAAYNGHKEIVEMLLNAGADPNASNNNKETPLHWAACNGRKEIFIILYPKTDIKYHTDPLIFKFKNELKNEVGVSYKIPYSFILQSYEFDTTSLFSKDYLSRDMVFLILKMTKKEKNLKKYRLMLKN